MSAPRKHIVDLYHVPTLGYHMMDAFTKEAEATGVRLEGIEFDANEWSDFFQKVAARALASLGEQAQEGAKP